MPVVWIANGLNYPDALSAAPAAAHQGGPLLLVTPTSIPGSIAAELARLDPGKIVVAGGPVSVSDQVVQQLQQYVAQPADVQRVFGADRFATSLAIAKFAFGENSTQEAYIATGLNFPDALSAGGAAAEHDAPVITVNGAESAIDQPTLDELNDLGVSKVTVVGGPLAVNQGILDTLSAATTDNVQRISGADRYAVSSGINQDAFDNDAVADAAKIFPSVGYSEAIHTDYPNGAPTTAIIATGENFPDALGGGALAGKIGAPLYVVPGTCIPLDVYIQLRAYSITHVILLGGTAALSSSVDDLTMCS